MLSLGRELTKHTRPPKEVRAYYGWGLGIRGLPSIAIYGVTNSMKFNTTHIAERMGSIYQTILYGIS